MFCFSVVSEITDLQSAVEKLFYAEAANQDSVL